MADLQIAPPRPRSVLPAVLIAVLVLAAVAWAVFRFNPDHVADLKVTDAQTFAPHTSMTSLESKVHGNMRVLSSSTAAAGEDDVYVVATVSLTNRLRLPLFLEGTQTHITLADGQQLEPRMIFGDTLKRLQGIFPALAPLVKNPLALDDQVDPGQTRTGAVVLLLPGITADAWTKKREASAPCSCATRARRRPKYLDRDGARPYCHAKCHLCSAPKLIILSKAKDLPFRRKRHRTSGEQQAPYQINDRFTAATPDPPRSWACLDSPSPGPY